MRDAAILTHRGRVPAAKRGHKRQCAHANSHVGLLDLKYQLNPLPSDLIGLLKHAYCTVDHLHNTVSQKTRQIWQAVISTSMD